MRVCSRVLAAVMFVLLLGATPADAQSVGFRITYYGIRMDIQRDGSVKVRENLEVDFADEQRRGIFRTIQVRFAYEPDPKFERVYRISDVRTTATGASARNEISDEGRYKIFKIGDPEQTVTGAHSYTISYTIHGALNGFEDQDELYWNAIGLEWEIPIEQTQIVVSAPGGINQARCFTGPFGSQLECDDARVESPAEAFFAQAGLSPGEGVTVAVAMTKGVVPAAALEPILDEKWSLARAFAVTPATVGAAAALLVVGGLWLARMVWRTGRDRRASAGTDEERMPVFDKHRGPVQYRPPDDARPAQVGVLIDETADPLDVTATIVDLGVRGYLAIEEIEKDGLFNKADWRMTKVKPADESLVAYEQRLFEALFDGRDEVQLSELKNTFASDLREVQSMLYDDSVKRGWFRQRPDHVRTKWIVLGVLAVVAAGGVVVLLAAFTHTALVGVPLVLVALALLASHELMPARTGKGSTALGQVVGFRRYMETAEADRMQFAEEENIFAKYLPYAIVFKETERWAKAFQGIYGDNPPPGMGWYSPYGSWHAFSFGHFASSMSSFTVQTSGTIVSTPAASGGSAFSGGGGGGFSGGGGGGGGGGGW